MAHICTHTYTRARARAHAHTHAHTHQVVTHLTVAQHTYDCIMSQFFWGVTWVIFLNVWRGAVTWFFLLDMTHNWRDVVTRLTEAQHAFDCTMSHIFMRHRLLRQKSLHLQKRILFLQKRILFLVKRALHPGKRVLHLSKRALCLSKRALYLYGSCQAFFFGSGHLLELGSCWVQIWARQCHGLEADLSQ